MKSALNEEQHIIHQGSMFNALTSKPLMSIAKDLEVFTVEKL